MEENHKALLRWEVNKYGQTYHALGHVNGKTLYSFSTRWRVWLELRIALKTFLWNLEHG
jgi:hypothetical protein